MTKKGLLMSIRAQIRKLEYLQRKFKKDCFNNYIENQLQRYRKHEEKIKNEIDQANPDCLRGREKT